MVWKQQIHSIVQIYVHDNRSWVTMREKVLDNPLDYQFYAIVANVHQSYIYQKHHPISQPRGLPYDLKKVASQDDIKQSLGDRNYGWLLLAEIQDYITDQRRLREEAKQGIINEMKQLLQQSSDMLYEDLHLAISRINTGIYHPNIEDCDTLFRLVDEIENIQKENRVEADEIRYVFGFTSK